MGSMTPDSLTWSNEANYREQYHVTGNPNWMTSTPRRRHNPLDLTSKHGDTYCIRDHTNAFTKLQGCVGSVLPVPMCSPT